MIKDGDKVKIVGRASYSHINFVGREGTILSVDCDAPHSTYCVEFVGVQGFRWFPAASVEKIVKLPKDYVAVGYVENTTGKEPVGVARSARVAVVMRDGHKTTSNVGSFRWNLEGNGYRENDIVGYKLLDAPDKTLAQKVEALEEENRMLKEENERQKAIIAAVVKAVA